MVNHRSFPYKNSEIGYHVFGHGSTPIVCFHGYGEDGESFLFLEKYLGDQFSLIALDLPFHGITNWREKVFSQDDLLAVIKELLVVNGFSCGNSNVTLLAFSLGGRIALNVYELMPSSIIRII